MSVVVEMLVCLQLALAWSVTGIFLYPTGFRPRILRLVGNETSEPEFGVAVTQ